MLAQGKPNMFQMSSYPSACYIPQSYCELQSLRLRKVIMSIHYPVRSTDFWDKVTTSDQDYNKRLAGLKQEFAELATVVGKSQSLVELHLDLQTEGVTHYRDEDGVVHFRAITSDCNVNLVHMLDPLLVPAGQKNFLLTAKEDKDFVKKLSRNDHYKHSTSKTTKIQLYINHAQTLRDAPTSATAISGKTITTANGSYDLVTYPPIPYELVPECRRCYRNFKTEAELREHLAEVARHRIKFRKQQDNGVSLLAEAYATGHKCLVGGRGYESRHFRDKHCQRFGHWRDNQTRRMVPRFRKDHEWYRCTFWTENEPPAFPPDKGH